MDTIKKLGRGLVRLILTEPVYTQALVVALIAWGTAFGLQWNGAQVGATCGLSAAFLAWLTKKVVTPLAAPVIPSGTEVTVETPAGQPNESVTV